jgi:hypothetical protein
VPPDFLGDVGKAEHSRSSSSFEVQVYFTNRKKNFEERLRDLVGERGF